MKKRLRAILLAVVALILAGGLMTESRAQRRLFSHNTAAHKQGKYKDCSSCHTLPTKNWTSPRRDKLAAFPDVVNFPYHTSCFGCHTRDIYSNGGAFCGTCHTVPTMRARAVLAFPIKSHPSQFTTLFPHDVHQDLIASNRGSASGVAVAHFVPAAFYPLDEKPKPTFYNCAICHETTARIPKNEPRKLGLLKPLCDIVPDVFQVPIKAEFFKDSPSGHESCFTCHYQFKNLPADKQSCAGCHEMTKPFFEKEVIRRYSLKFDHDRVGHVEKDCVSCHLRITQNADIRTMKDADVPIVACRQCHATQEDQPFRRILTTEIEERDASLAKPGTQVFQCTYCHTSAIGRYEIPASHLK